MEGFTFKWEAPHGGASVLMGAEGAPPCTPTMGNPGGYMLQKDRISREVGFFIFFHFFDIVFFLLFTKSI